MQIYMVGSLLIASTLVQYDGNFISHQLSLLSAINFVVTKFFFVYGQLKENVMFKVCV